MTVESLVVYREMVVCSPVEAHNLFREELAFLQAVPFMYKGIRLLLHQVPLEHEHILYRAYDTMVAV